MTNVPQNSVAVSAPIVYPEQNSYEAKLRNAVKSRIYPIIRHKLQPRFVSTDAAWVERIFRQLTVKFDAALFRSATSLEEYGNLDSLENRVVHYLEEAIRKSSQRLAAAATTPSYSVGIIGGSQPTHNLDTSMHSFQSGTSGGFSIGPDPHIQQSAGANHQMVNVYRPNINQITCGNINQTTCGISSPRIANGTRTSQELVSATHLSTLSRHLLQPSHQLQEASHMHRCSTSNADYFVSNNLYGSGSMAVAHQDSNPLNMNPMQTFDATFTSNQPNLQGMQQQTPLPKQQLLQIIQSAATSKENMAAQVSQQLVDQGFHQIEHQGQHSQKLYPGQLYKDANLTQVATGLAAPINHGPSLEFYKEALQRQATNRFKPSKLQYQQTTAVKDHYIGSQSAAVISSQMNSSQSAAVISSQMNSSPSFRPHPHQTHPASVLVQRQPSIQNSTELLQNNNGERKHIGVNLCQRTPMQPDTDYRFSSAVAPISGQTVSPRSTAERKRLRRSSKQVNGDSPEEYWLVCKWLLFMEHARHCIATEDKCGSKHCVEAKKLLRHIDSCKVPDCKYQHCRKTKNWIIHNKQCTKDSCSVCVTIRKYKKKEKARRLSLRRAKFSSASSKRQPRKAYNKSSSVDGNNLQPSIKRLKMERGGQNATLKTKSISVSQRGVVGKPRLPMDMQKKDGLQRDDCKSVVMPMDVDASWIPVSRELEKHVSEDTFKGRNGGDFAMDDKTRLLVAQGKSKCMNEMSAPKEENVERSVNVVDVSRMEISSLVELFTPEQVKEHIRSLRQWVGQSKTKAEKNKAMECSMSVNSCQLCAVESLVFEPVPIYCSCCGVRIKKNALHFSVATGESRHYVCAPCYNEARENSVSVDGAPISKARLEKKKNDEQVGEGWVQCDKCEAWQHQICALFNSRRNHGEATKYTCPKCYIKEVEQRERRPLPSSAIPGAKDLPVTALSNHIEERLFKNLKRERQERARLEGKSYEEVPGAESLTVRVVASVDKVLEVKDRFLEIFREENYPSEFPYKSKAILLFQKIENVEVCLFSMFVQEFGTESGPPNQRRVYLSYLDSVKYFRPEVRTVSGEALRTFVYHEILIGYLDYCKKRGFTSCYIWACPPLKGEDYILYCHPEIQKTPKTDKLREWYLEMLRKASKEDVVVECTNLYDHFFVQSDECRANVTAARLPYFDGDYWPGAAEDLIGQMSQEDDGTNLNRKGLTKKTISKRALRAVGQLDLSVNASKDRLMMQKLGETICPMKEDFIMVHLQHCCKHCTSLMVSGNRWVCNQCKNFQICDKCNEVEQRRIEKERHPINRKEKHELCPVAIKDVPTKIEDKDGNLESEFFDNRQAFLSLCQGNNYQYDTLRRAKHSSMMILYHLHNPTAPAFATICTICQHEVENSQGWHCNVCPSFDVCNACYSKASINHSHKLIRRSSSTDTVVQHNGQTNQYQHEKIKELLVHVAACRSTHCQYQRCRSLKMLFRHCIACKIGPRNCTYCKNFWSLLKLHARCCRDSQCTVPKCRELRALSRRQQQQSEKRRRAAVMEMMRERAAEATRTC